MSATVPESVIRLCAAVHAVPPAKPDLRPTAQRRDALRRRTLAGGDEVGLQTADHLDLLRQLDGAERLLASERYPKIAQVGEDGPLLRVGSGLEGVFALGGLLPRIDLRH